MPSPFPGMNPYIESPSVWHDFHESFIPAARDALSPQLVPQYIVRIDERVYLHQIGSEENRFLGRGDVTVAGLHPHGERMGTALLDAAVEVEVPEFDVEGISYLEILDRESRELITVIELLSPTNKNAGADREQYIAKAREVLRSRAHLVEIDLLRAGPRMPWLRMPACDYCVVVSSSDLRPRAQLWPVHLRDPLPAIPIPLRPGDGYVRLDLQPLLHHIHDAAGYQYYIYNSDPEPRLSTENATWARQLVSGFISGP